MHLWVVGECREVNVNVKGSGGVFHCYRYRGVGFLFFTVPYSFNIDVQNAGVILANVCAGICHRHGFSAEYCQPGIKCVGSHLTRREIYLLYCRGDDIYPTFISINLYGGISGARPSEKVFPDLRVVRTEGDIR